jgi:hypothetical protein
MKKELLRVVPFFLYADRSRLASIFGHDLANAGFQELRWFWLFCA